MRVQRRQVRRASLVICISEIFREHLMRDYGLRAEASVVVANPCGSTASSAPAGHAGARRPSSCSAGSPRARGIEDVVALARLDAGAGAGGPLPDRRRDERLVQLHKLLEHLPAENAEYAG